LIIYNDETKIYELNNESLDIIGSVETDIIFISIVGRQRSGKSFLLNKLLYKFNMCEFEDNHFTVGDSINPCTEGIWIYNKPIKYNN